MVAEGLIAAITSKLLGCVAPLSLTYCTTQELGVPRLDIIPERAANSIQMIVAAGKLLEIVTRSTR